MTVSLFRISSLVFKSKIIMSVGLLMMSASQSQATVDDLPSAESILDRHVEATGGKQAHLKLKTRKKTGKFEADIAGHMLKAKIVEHAQAPNKSHLSFDGSPMTMVRVCNGKDVWEWNPGHHHGSGEKVTDSQLNEHTRLLEGPQKARTITAAQFYRRVEWRKYVKSVKTIGLKDVKGKPAYEVQVTPKNGKAYSQFYDKKSGRLVKYKNSKIDRSW